MARNLFDELGIKPVIPESANPGVLRSAGDLGLEVVSGGIKGLRFITDVAGADNPVSGGLRVADKAVKGLQSLRAQYEDEEVARIMRDAEDKGVGEQAMAALRAAGIAPVRMGVGAVATGAPSGSIRTCTAMPRCAAAITANSMKAPQPMRICRPKGSVSGSRRSPSHTRWISPGSRRSAIHGWRLCGFGASSACASM